MRMILMVVCILGCLSLISCGKKEATLKEGLEIGDLAPEITGKDQDGIEFKLSDYRGKVVVIDFWADW